MSYVPAADRDGYRWYGVNPYNPRGARENKGLCAVEVFEPSTPGIGHQCSGVRGHGEFGLYCEEHNPFPVEPKPE